MAETDFYEFELDDTYTGPLDLLYLLMKKEEIDFEKISIAKIADKYLERIQDLENVDLAYAGDFLALASQLITLKTKELLAINEPTEENLLDFEINRDETIIRRIEEYQKYKRVALGLQEMEDKNFGTYGRGRMEKIGKDGQLADANIWQLFKAFYKTLQAHSYNSIHANASHTIEVDKVTIEDRQQFIDSHLAQRGRAMFQELLGKEVSPIMTVVTFIAFLELTKTEAIIFRQSETNGPLWLYRKKQTEDFKVELAQEKIYYTPDPDVAPGLTEYLRNQTLAKEMAEKTSLDTVLKSAMQLIESGIEIKESDVQNMLDGVYAGA